MKTIIIQDLHIETALDGEALRAVRGGTYAFRMPAWSAPSFDLHLSDTKFDASQQLMQGQNTQVNNGNNVAFASGITANVTPTQNGSNNINFH
ncbi:hypothetical protein SAMN06265795_1242 [Noviherbaspirillum humi]|uniref:Uncharacterized protein n=1 Tax=Noviherbaspirillum humi TaxID=1688639 RepID=A0A239LM61_9BURK|nr:hypothetical protein [Noviherbaspirillum humi]SNT30759.1 hypothetical protein SAMN06265795_1242 [Noviherbaspirillum humi]